MKCMSVLILCTHLVFQSSECANILFFFAGGTYSHKISVWPLVAAMADRGHNVTFVSSFDKQPFRAKSPVNDITSQYMIKAMHKHYQHQDRLSQRLNDEERKLWDNYHQDIIKHCKIVYSAVKEEEELSRVFYNETYDLIVNNLIFGECGFPIAHRVMKEGGKMVIFDSSYVICWLPQVYGFPAETSWIPDAAAVRDFPMDFYQRLLNFFTPIYWYAKRHWELFPPMERMMRELYPDEVPVSFGEIERNASMILAATHHTMDFARSLPPFIVNIGGMQCWQERKALEGEMKDFLNNATNGAVLIAFGSTIDLSTMPPYFKNIFFEVIDRFPEIQFIWRWDGELPANHPKNLKVATWLQQYEILGHPNLKAFVSHGGLNSLTEATCQGVPLVVFPLFADQDYNAYRVQAYQVGVRLEARTLTTDVMEKALREVLTSEKYTNNMKEMSKATMDRPMDPVETATYWLEFVLRHQNTKSLKPLNTLAWWQQNMLDIFALLSFAMAVFILSVILMVRRGIRMLSQTKSTGSISDKKNK